MAFGAPISSANGREPHYIALIQRDILRCIDEPEFPCMYSGALSGSRGTPGKPRQYTIPRLFQCRELGRLALPQNSYISDSMMLTSASRKAKIGPVPSMRDCWVVNSVNNS